MDLTVDKATDGIQRIDVWRALARGCSYPSWHSRSERFQRVIGRSLHSRLASDETQKKDNQLLYSKPKVLFFILFWERMDTFALLSRQESFSGNVKYSKGGKCDMRPETAQEKEFHNLLPPDLRERSHVAFGYQENLRIIQSHLQKFYGQRADWSQCVTAYFNSQAYRDSCHSAKCCEDMPTISADQLYAMIREDENYHSNAKKFLDLNQKIQKGDGCQDDIFCAAAMLGILPDHNTFELFNWIIRRQGLSDQETQEIKGKITSNIGLFVMVLNLFSTMFVPGIRLTFPLIGTAITQQRSKFYYRGESAFYGSSKPGMFRGDSISPMQHLANFLILDEACFFLKQFDAVQKWFPSCVNYHALAQHYGIKTPLLDITSDLKTALFFACCNYEHHQWRPMGKRDFVYKKDRNGAKDCRYGILYRTPTEITDIKWALITNETEGNLITPIGYQPFMRCSAQYGYMIYARDESYNLLEDPLFDKFRFEHDEDFCRWIFEEMDCGSKVYPLDDIPKIEEYMEAIRNTHVISRTAFENYCKKMHYSKYEVQAIKHKLQKEGYTVSAGQVKYIRNYNLRKINKKYSVEVAYSKLDIPPSSRPMVILPSNTLVEQDEDGNWILASSQS